MGTSWVGWGVAAVLFLVVLLKTMQVSALEADVARLQEQLKRARAGGGAAPEAPAAAGDAWQAEVREHLRAGNKIQAIKVYREHTGVGLKEAKDAVEAMPEGR